MKNSTQQNKVITDFVGEFADYEKWEHLMRAVEIMLNEGSSIYFDSNEHAVEVWVFDDESYCEECDILYGTLKENLRNAVLIHIDKKHPNLMTEEVRNTIPETEH